MFRFAPVVAAVLLTLSLVAIPTDAQRTDVQRHGVVRNGFGGNFTAVGFGGVGFVVAECALIQSRLSLPAPYAMEIFFWWSFGAADPTDLRLLVGPGVERRRSHWLQHRTLGLRVVVPKCTTVTFYVLDLQGRGNDVTINAGPEEPGGGFSVNVPSYADGAYVSINQTVGSRNYTVVQTTGANIPVLAGVFFDDIPGCTLERPATAPWTEVQHDATLLFNAGGNLSEHGFGSRGYYLTAGESPAEPRTNLPTSDGYNVAISTTEYRGATWHPLSDRRLIVAPFSGAPRQPFAMSGRNGGDLTFTVTVPRCSLVRFYLLDLYNNVVSAEVRRPGQPTIVLDHAITQGIFITFQQQEPTAQYITNKGAGPNVPFLGLTIDDDPGCSANFERVGPAELRWAAGGDFRGTVGVGARAFLLGGFADYPARYNMDTRHLVEFNPPAVGAATWDVQNSSDPRLLRPPTGQARANVWYRPSGPLTVTVGVPSCTRVTFYFLDYDSDVRRLIVRRDGAAVIRLDRSFHDGVYATLVQRTATATYEISHTAGANAVLSGIFFDDLTGFDGACTFVPAPVSPGTASPPAVGAGCSATYVSSGEAWLVRGLGGDLGNELTAFGRRAMLLGGYQDDESRRVLPSGYYIGFPVYPGDAWTAGAPSGYPVSRLLRPPGGAPRTNSWFANDEITVTVTVPVCSAVTFYFLDFDSTSRRFTLSRHGTELLRYSECSFAEGMYVRVMQQPGAARYTVARIGSYNAVLSGVMVDDMASDSCSSVPSSPNVPSGGVPPSAANEDEADSDAGGFSSGAAVGIAIGIVAVIAIAVAAGICAGMNMRRRPAAETEADETRPAAGGQAPPFTPAEGTPANGVVVGTLVQPEAERGPYAPSGEYGYPPKQGKCDGYPMQPSATTGDGDQRV